MKILRIRRGYTTNSSGGNEWVPPANLNANGNGPNGAATPPVAQPAAKQVTVLATQPQQRAETAAPAQTKATRSDKTASNLGIMGGLFALVLLLFILTGVVKRIWRR